MVLDKPIFPYSYVQRWIKDKSRYKIGMFARQTLKTTGTTFDLVMDCLERRTKWIILSKGERQAREAMLEGVLKHLEFLNVLAKYDDKTEFEIDKETKIKVLEVTFKNGSRIIALPANPATARGFSGNVFLDEFAFHEDSRKIWGALFPVASANGFRIIVTSTPNGKNNKFYELMTAESSIWSRHTCDIYQAVADGLPRNIDELKAGLNDDDLWAQEYELKWLDENSAWLSFDLINSVENDKAGIPELYTGNPVFIGNDIGRRNDAWVACVGELVGDVIWTREIVRLRNKTFAEQDFVLDELVKKYKVARVCMDQTGMGEKPVEDAQRRYGSIVEGVQFTLDTKQYLANIAKSTFEDRKIRIPMGDNVLRSALHKIKRVDSATGKPRFVADRDSNGHADDAWATFLMISAAARPAAKIEYTPLPSKDKRWNPSIAANENNHYDSGCL